jgi:Tol biopolymer transport system component
MRAWRRIQYPRVRAVRPLTAVLAAGAILALAGTTSLVLVASGGPAQATSPARNGLIAFAGDRGSGPQVYTIEPDGTGLRRLTDVKGDASSPDWSPDGDRIAFWVEDKGLDVMNADGSDLHKLTARDGPPAFTPDGQHLVYGCCSGAHPGGVFLMRDDGSDAPGVRLTRNPFKQEDDTTPEVSPDGKTVTFVRNKAEGKLAALYAVNIDGSDVRRLTSYRLEVGFKHDWAPDGRHIVLTAHGDHAFGKSPNVATIRSDGSHLRMLTDHTGPNSGALAGSYSPDGRRIVFRTGNLKRQSSRLYKVRPDGTHLTLIRRLPFQPRFSDWGPRP